MPPNRGQKGKPANPESVSAEATAPPADEEAASEFEAAHVHAVYSDIAMHFSATRHTAWPLVQKFMDDFEASSIILDVGCGNGKYLYASAGRGQYAVGIDPCAELIDLAAKNTKTECMVGNCLDLPYRDGVFDGIICIAVIHHLSTRQRRIAAFNECLRVLKHGGVALFYVWAQERYNSNELNEDVKNYNCDRQGQGQGQCDSESNGSNGVVRSKMMRRKFEHQDMLIPWHLRSKKDDASNERILGKWHQVHKRFYHIYTRGELEEELEATWYNLIIKKSYYDHQNWCIVVQKECP